MFRTLFKHPAAQISVFVVEFSRMFLQSVFFFVFFTEVGFGDHHGSKAVALKVNSSRILGYFTGI